MTTNMDMSVYRKVVSGELSPEQGRAVLMEAQQKESLLKQPTWMPKSMYVIFVIVGAFIFAPFIGAKDRA
ncbi:hypothetical protein ACN6A1_35705 [Myxococcus virescens]|uniref:hypothetical protein n=1 Tax=Myxococcus virescens TaxID=83456 RepID=UPI003DA4A741